jgi:integrase
MKLTATAVKTAQIEWGKSEAIFFDDDIPGFGLRLREGGSRSFIFQYKQGAKHRRMALGKATPDTIGDARKTAAKLHARVKLGEDPASDKAEARAKAAHTFLAATQEYLGGKREQLRPRTYPDLERHLLKHSRSLHELQLAKITRADIATAVAAVSKNAGAVTANRVRTSLSGFFTWAMQQGVAETNPVIGTMRNEERSRDRVLTPAELRLIWSELGDDDFGSIIKLLALTGQRAAEIAGLSWSEIADDDTIIMAGERTKNHRPHTVPLSAPAAAIIAAQPRRERRDLIFGRGEKPFSGWSNCKERLDERIAKANDGKPLPHWTPHDLRRTFATYAGGGLPEHQFKKLPARDREAATGLGIQPHVVEAALNHVSGARAGVAGTYNRSTYAREKKAALDLWADRLMAIVEGCASNVTALRRENAS